MFKTLVWSIVLLMALKITTSYANEISVGIAVKENKYIADIKDIVTKAYEEIGKTVVWQKLPTERSLRLTNTGKIDAEFLRVNTVADEYENLIKIETPLIYAAINLYCETPRDCELALLGKIPVGYNISYKIYESICKKQHLMCHGVNTDGDPSVLFKHNKLNVILSNDVEIAASLVNFDRVLFKSQRLEEVTGHHYINKNHKEIVSKLEKQFSNRAKEIKANSNTIADLVKNNEMIKQLDF